MLEDGICVLAGTQLSHKKSHKKSRTYGIKEHGGQDCTVPPLRKWRRACAMDKKMSSQKVGLVNLGVCASVKERQIHSVEPRVHCKFFDRF